MEEMNQENSGDEFMTSLFCSLQCMILRMKMRTRVIGMYVKMINLPKTKQWRLTLNGCKHKHFDGFLPLSPDEAAKVPHLSRRKAREILKYGAEQEGYWNSNRFMEVKIAADIATHKYPADKFCIVWLFDQSSGHCAYEDSALNLWRMNVNPGGKQPKMRTTTNLLVDSSH